jgi:hypothetical protein
MSVPMSRAKSRLALLWFGWLAIMGFFMILQTMFGNYNNPEGVREAWGWWATTVLPVPALMVSVLATEATGRAMTKSEISKLVYRSTLFFTWLYILAAGATLGAAPLHSRSEPLAFMRLSNLWLGPLLSLSIALVGVFFVSTQEEGQDPPHTPATRVTR